MTLKQAEDSPGIVDIGQPKEPGLVNQMPFRIGPYPHFGELVGSYHR